MNSCTLRFSPGYGAGYGPGYGEGSSEETAICPRGHRGGLYLHSSGRIFCRDCRNEYARDISSGKRQIQSHLDPAAVRRLDRAIQDGVTQADLRARFKVSNEFIAQRAKALGVKFR
jgi:hypothetical protein